MVRFNGVAGLLTCNHGLRKIKKTKEIWISLNWPDEVDWIFTLDADKPSNWLNHELDISFVKIKDPDFFTQLPFEPLDLDEMNEEYLANPEKFWSADPHKFVWCATGVPRESVDNQDGEVLFRFGGLYIVAESKREPKSLIARGHVSLYEIFLPKLREMITEQEAPRDKR